VIDTATLFATVTMNRFAQLLSFLCLMLVGASAWVSQPFPRTSRASSTFLSMSSEDLSKGTVKWFDTMKGFGFIVPADGSSDIFVHQTEIQAEGFRSLADGEEVEYHVETDASGRRKAVRVTGPDGANVQGAPFRPQNDYDSY